MTPKPIFEQLGDLIGLRSNSSAFEVRAAALGLNPASLEVSEHLASIVDKRHGFEIALRDEAMIALKPHEKLSGIWVVQGVHLHSSGHEGFNGFSEPLPLGVTFQITRSELHKKLGAPVSSGGGNTGPGKLVWPAWDSYAWENGSLIRFQYGLRSNLEVVTLFRPRPQDSE